MRFFANIFGALGEYIANITSGACIISLLDEPEMPEELL